MQPFVQLFFALIPSESMVGDTSSACPFSKFDYKPCDKYDCDDSSDDYRHCGVHFVLG